MDKKDDKPVWRWFNKQEIINDLLFHKLTPTEKDHIKTLKEDEVRYLFSSLGRYVRNTYRLLEQDNPFSKHEKATELSQQVVGEVWSRLTGNSYTYDPQADQEEEEKLYIDYFTRVSAAAGNHTYTLLPPGPATVYINGQAIGSFTFPVGGGGNQPQSPTITPNGSKVDHLPPDPNIYNWGNDDDDDDQSVNQDGEYN